MQLFDLIVTHERLPDTKLRGRHLSAGKYPCPTGNELPQPEFTDPARAVFGMFGAMIFDLAHFDARDHSADFVAEVQRINFSLEAKELAAFTQMTRDLLEHIKKFEDVLA